VQLAVALNRCHLLISDTRTKGVAEIDMFADLRRRRLRLPIVYLANAERSTPGLEAQLPAGVPILREPFTAEELRSVAKALMRTSEPLQ
jgi:hypothetical protein